MEIANPLLLIIGLLSILLSQNYANGQYLSSSRPSYDSGIDLAEERSRDEGMASIPRRYEIKANPSDDLVMDVSVVNSSKHSTIPQPMIPSKSSDSIFVQSSTPSAPISQGKPKTTMNEKIPPLNITTTTTVAPIILTSTTCLPCLVDNEPNNIIKSYVNKVVKDESSSTSIWIVLSLLLIIVTAVIIPMLIYLLVTQRQSYPTPIENGPHVNASDLPSNSPLSEAFGVPMSRASYSPPQQLQLQRHPKSTKKQPLEGEVQNFGNTAKEKSKSKKLFKSTRKTIPILKFP